MRDSQTDHHRIDHGGALWRWLSAIARAFHAQIVAWRKVVDAVHRAGGLIAAQLWHVGRARGEDAAAGRPPGWAVSGEIKPHELEPADLVGTVEKIAAGARAALSAGFDSVEIQNGNGFLLDRFLRPATNLREDSPERFAKGAPLNIPDAATFYTPGPAGLIDYPRHA
jgi:NADH:flavin oxidoreductase / NADH oxidase family